MMTATPRAGAIKDVLLTSKKMLAILWQEDKRTFVESVLAVLIPGIVPFINAYIYAQIINFVIHIVCVTARGSFVFAPYVLIAIRIGMLFIQI